MTHAAEQSSFRRRGRVHRPKVLPGLAACVVLLVTLLAGRDAWSQETGESPSPQVNRWWKGNLHTHSLWSDGNDFPEMIAAWYRDHDYHFLALSDHNILSEGDRWMRFEAIASRGGHEAVDKYRARFGDQWVETRGATDTNAYQVRLKPLNEFRSLLERDGEFLMIQSEEISDRSQGVPVHLNAANLRDLLPPVGGQTVRETIENNVRAAIEQAERTGRPIMVHLNHPNFGYAVTAEDLAHAVSEPFFEIYNGHPGVNQLGDGTHPNLDRLWDIANTIRLAKLDAPPLFGLGTDDSHNYHSSSGSTSGRGWVMVRSPFLTPRHLIDAMNAGDFYASSGVTLADVRFDAESGTIQLEIAAEDGVQYRTEFIGTREGYDDTVRPVLDDEGNEIRTTFQYSDEVGEVLAVSEGHSATYQLRGDELYVRAVIHSDKPHPNPSIEGQVEQAWTQPVGWRRRFESEE